jgi:hypothetical protein
MKISHTVLPTPQPSLRAWTLYISRSMRPSYKPKRYLYEYSEMHIHIKTYTFRNQTVRNAALIWLRENKTDRVFTILPINK